MYQKDKSGSKVKFRQASCKRVLEAAKLPYANKTKESITYRKLARGTFGKLLIVFSTKVNLVNLLYLTARRCCLLHLIGKLVAENFSKNSNLDDSGISLPVFPSRSNLKLHNISETLKMVKKVIMNLDLPKASGRSTADLLIVASDRIARAFSRSGATQAVALDISKTFDRVWRAGLLHKLKSCGISGQVFGRFLLFSVIDGLEWFWTESLHKNIQLMLEFLKAPFLVLHFSTIH